MMGWRNSKCTDFYESKSKTALHSSLPLSDFDSDLTSICFCSSILSDEGSGSASDVSVASVPSVGVDAAVLVSSAGEMMGNLQPIIVGVL